MKKIQNFGDFKDKKSTVSEAKVEPVEREFKETIITERKLGWGEVAEIKSKILAELEKQKSKIGKMFGPKTEEDAKSRTIAKFPNYPWAKEVVETGDIIPTYAGAGDRGDGMRHDNEFGSAWDDHNSDRGTIRARG